MLADPGQAPREGLALRRFLARWLGPAILYPRMTSLPMHERDWPAEVERPTSVSQDAAR
jgi:hypothetical protein